MSTFLNVVRFRNRDPKGGERLPIERSHLEALGEHRPMFKAHGAVGVMVLDEIDVVLQKSGSLSCQLSLSDDLATVVIEICALAELIPDAVALDEEGIVLSAQDWQ